MLEVNGSVEFEHTGGKKNPAFGKVGSVDYTLKVEEFTVNGESIEVARSLNWLIAYGLRQGLGDSYAQGKDLADCQDKLSKKVAKFIAGEIDIRTAADELNRTINRIADEKFVAFAGMSWAKLVEGVGKDKALSVWEKFRELNIDEFTKAAQDDIARRALVAVKADVTIESLLAEVSKPDESDEGKAA